MILNHIFSDLPHLWYQLGRGALLECVLCLCITAVSIPQNKELWIPYSFYLSPKWGFLFNSFYDSFSQRFPNLFQKTCQKRPRNRNCYFLGIWIGTAPLHYASSHMMKEAPPQLGREWPMVSFMHADRWSMIYGLLSLSVLWSTYCFRRLNMYKWLGIKSNFYIFKFSHFLNTFLFQFLLHIHLIRGQNIRLWLLINCTLNHHHLNIQCESLSTCPSMLARTKRSSWTMRLLLYYQMCNYAYVQRTTTMPLLGNLVCTQTFLKYVYK